MGSLSWELYGANVIWWSDEASRSDPCSRSAAGGRQGLTRLHKQRKWDKGGDKDFFHLGQTKHTLHTWAHLPVCCCSHSLTSHLYQVEKREKDFFISDHRRGFSCFFYFLCVSQVALPGFVCLVSFTSKSPVFDETSLGARIVLFFYYYLFYIEVPVFLLCSLSFNQKSVFGLKSAGVSPSIKQLKAWGCSVKSLSVWYFNPSTNTLADVFGPPFGPTTHPA